MNKQEAKQDKKQCITPSYENFMAGGNTDDEKAWFELGYKAASKTVAEQEKSMEDIDLKTAAVNYVTEKHNKQAGDVWYDENESDAQSFIAGFQYAALQTASLTRQNEDLRKALDTTLKAMVDLGMQLPTDERLVDYNLDYCESAEAIARKALSQPPIK